MKKSKIVNLVLVAGLATSCNHKKEENKERLFMRSDSTSQYSQTRHMYHGSYFYLRPYGVYSGGRYSHQGYESSGFSRKAGGSHSSSHISRGGFGSRGFHVGS